MKKITWILAMYIMTSCETPQEPVKVIGHRGAMGHAFENSMNSVEKAMELGVDMFEIDIFKVKSGEVVVFHDDRLENLTNGEGYIEDYNYFQLLQLRLNNGEKIPMLQHVLKKVDKQTQINIEIKGKGLASKLDQILDYYVDEKGWDPTLFLVSSFDWDQLKEFRSLNDRIAIGVLTEGDPLDAITIAEETKAMAIHPWHEKLNKKVVTDIHRKGFKVYPWTVNDTVRMQQLIEWGVDGIITDFPDRLQLLLSAEEKF